MTGLTGGNVRRLLELTDAPAGGRTSRLDGLPPAGPPGEVRTLTVGIVSHGDVNSTCLTVAAVRLVAPEVADRVALLLIDTDPRGPGGWALKALEWEVPGLRYVPADDVRGTAAARERVFREANADWVVVLGAGVLLAPGALTRLLSFVDEHPDCVDLLQGPQVHPDLSSVTTHWAPIWRDGRFGVAECDSRGVDPDGAAFEIPAQSLDLFACRRTAWLGFNPRFSGPGTEEGYLHHKFRLADRRTLCLPSLRWMRPSPASPMEAKSSGWERRIRNYLIGWDELGMPIEPVVEHFDKEFGREVTAIARARWQSENANPFHAFDGIFCINLGTRPDRWERMRRRLQPLGLADQVRHQPGVSTPWNYHVGCALAHRQVLDIARRQSMRSVLVLEDDAVFLQGATWVLRRNLRELGRRQWNLLFLGTSGHGNAPPFSLAEGCKHLVLTEGVRFGTHALVYHQRIYDHLLEELPSTVEQMEEWVKLHGAIDVYLSTSIDHAFHVSPMIAVQEEWIPSIDEDLRDQYVFEGQT